MNEPPARAAEKKRAMWELYSKTASQNGRRPSFRTFCQPSIYSDREDRQVYILQLCHVLTVYAYVLARIRTDTSIWQAPVHQAPTVRYRQH